jgi:hypothetical protein
MRRLVVAVALLAASASASAGPGAAAADKPRPEKPEKLIAEMLPRLDAAFGCPASRSVWCQVKTLWTQGTAADLPAAGVLAGLTIGLEAQRRPEELAAADVDFSAFAVKAGRGLVTDVPPTNAEEQRTLNAAVKAMTEALRTGKKPVLPAALARYLATLPAGATHPLSRTATEWRMSGKAEAWIRRGPAGGWIVVEVPGEGPPGIFISVYADEWMPAAP